MCQTLFYMLSVYKLINSITVVMVIIPILQMMKLRHREVKELAQGHIAGKGQSHDPTQLVCPKTTVFHYIL